MREGLTFVVIAATTAPVPFYANPYVRAGAIIIIAAIILGVAIMLFRSSGKKKKDNENNPAGAPGWQAGQQPQQGGWGAQNPAQQQGGWDQQQQGGWGAQNPAPQQAGWDQQQQQGGWGAQSPAQPQAGWGAPAQAPAQDPWAQQQPQQAAWGAQNPAQPQGFGASGSGQNWAPPAQQSPAQNAWGAPAQPGAPAAPGWGQPPQQQGFGGDAFNNSPDSDRTMLRSGGSAQNMPMGGAVAPGRMGIVRIEEGKEPGRIYEVRKESLSIGRSRESDIFLEDLAVSRLHASIVNQGNGNFALRDEGSANGTKVNGQPVNKYQPCPLQEGDKVQLGQTVLVFGRR
jgi:FHA domain-containing protein